MSLVSFFCLSLVVALGVWRRCVKDAPVPVATNGQARRATDEIELSDLHPPKGLVHRITTDRISKTEQQQQLDEVVLRRAGIRRPVIAASADRIEMVPPAPAKADDLLSRGAHQRRPVTLSSRLSEPVTPPDVQQDIVLPAGMTRRPTVIDRIDTSSAVPPASPDNQIISRPTGGLLPTSTSVDRIDVAKHRD